MTQGSKELDPAVDPTLDEPYSGIINCRYLILSQQRSGSNWLCANLINANDFGVPAEYLNAKHVIDINNKMLGNEDKSDESLTQIDVDAYMRYVSTMRTSRKGIFGLKIQPYQLLTLYTDNVSRIIYFIAQFDRIILLDRKDKLSQSVSGAIAEATNIWRPYGEEPDIANVDQFWLVDYIARKLAMYIAQEQQAGSWSEAARRPILRLHYEDMMEKPEETFLQVAKFIDPDTTHEKIPNENRVLVPKPPPGQVAAALRAKFLDYIEGRASV